jgi:membrane-bound ClpP family serine protease
MWIIAGVLLGLMVLVGLVGFHTGPHSHVVAGVLGALAAAWLVVMALDGRSSSLLWALLSADLVVSTGLGALAWKGLSAAADAADPEARRRLSEGTEGVALTALTPEGIVRVRGEDWSAVSRNGDVPAGGHVQVLRAAGLRLEVWREELVPAGELFSLEVSSDDLDHARNGVASSPEQSFPSSQPSPSEPSPTPADLESKDTGS